MTSVCIAGKTHREGMLLTIQKPGHPVESSRNRSLMPETVESRGETQNQERMPVVFVTEQCPPLPTNSFH